MDPLQRFATAFLKEFPSNPELLPIAIATLEGDTERLTELLLQQMRGFVHIQRLWEQMEPMILDVKEKADQYEKVATEALAHLRAELDRKNTELFLLHEKLNSPSSNTSSNQEDA